MGPKVLMTAKTLATPGLALLEQAGCAVSFLKEGTEAELAESLRSTPFDAVISRTLALPAIMIETAPALRVISRHGVGYNNVDIESATRRGVPVLIADGANGKSVAELAVGLALSVARKITTQDASIRARQWNRSAYGLQFAGKTAGIVAFGAIGRRVAEILRAMDMRIIAFDPHARDCSTTGVDWTETLDELLQESDLVSLHCPLTPETRNMITAPRLARMKPGAILINTARGGLIDEKALAEAVLSGHLAGAGLDTFADEPLPADHPFLSLPQIVMTPHMGGSTDAALDGVAISAARNVLDVLIDGKVDRRLLVNPAVLEHRTVEAK
ncbi:hydroxyacid dehydrogenase [Sinorhizobium medicae]|uniref:hydroxyacid dehydrogenase n=1 Tax=Sinorhizobium medicae TaxID=110321 RepID=UPI000C7AE549|nr:hydroxyacid dehydrogenase [Sinorhizobium medicae]PLU43397.1 hydroxyacid dehydrogenase [Sinorhizobium medicae]RVQ44806.1 hydroxyacid dehydrogenase [Sinorhizobium medicae]